LDDTVEVKIEDRVEPAPKRPRISQKSLDATVKTKIEELLGTSTLRLRDWGAVLIYLQNNDLTVEGAQRALSQVRSFVSDLEEELRPTHATDGKGNLEKVIRLAFRAAGVQPELALVICEKKLTWQKNAFSQFGKSLGQTIDDLYALRPLENGFRIAIPHLKTLSEAPMIQDQIRIFKEIDALLKEELAKLEQPVYGFGAGSRKC
jgi:hypothetical protein